MTIRRYGGLLGAACALSLGAACSGDPDSQRTGGQAARSDTRSPWSFADFPEPSDSTPVTDTLIFDEVGRFGAEDERGWMAGVDRAAVNTNWLAVSAWRACEIVVFSRTTRQQRSRFGQCGDGPGDFENLGGMQWKGDTLLVSDRFGRRLQYLTLDGVVARTVVFDTVAVPENVSNIDGIEVATDSSLLLLLSHSGHHSRAGTVLARNPTSPFVREVPLSGHGRRYSAFVDGLGVSQHSYGDVLEVPACVLPRTTDGGARVLVGYNPWRVQLVALPINPSDDRARMPLLNWVATGFDSGPIRDTKQPLRMIAASPDFACGQSLALSSDRRWTDPDSTVRLSNEVTLLGVNPRTQRKAMLRLRDSSIPVLHGRLLTAHGDSFFFGHNNRFDYPQVVEVRVRMQPK